MTGPTITIPTSDTPLLVSCVQCNHQEMVLALALLRGTDWICRNCGAHIELSPNAGPSGMTVRYSTGQEDTTVELATRADGLWAFLDQGERSILDVLDHDSDRSVAVITGAMIERRLEQAIRNRSCRNETIEARLFNPSGPLGTFSAKIDLAYLTGIISDVAHHDLVIFKDIRNLFAHNLAIQRFNSQRIKDRAKNLRLVDSLVADLAQKPGAALSTRINFEPDRTPAIFVTHASARKKRARDRYLMTAQLFTIRFAVINLKRWSVPRL